MSDIYKIEQGIEVPKRAVRAGTSVSKAALTLAQLKKGDSFLVKDPYEAIKADKVMRDLLRREKEKGGKRMFVSRRMANGSMRIFRTK